MFLINRLITIDNTTAQVCAQVSEIFQPIKNTTNRRKEGKRTPHNTPAASFAPTAGKGETMEPGKSSIMKRFNYISLNVYTLYSRTRYAHSLTLPMLTASIPNTWNCWLPCSASERKHMHLTLVSHRERSPFHNGGKWAFYARRNSRWNGDR